MCSLGVSEFKSSIPRAITLDTILECVSLFCRIPADAIKSKHRKQNVVTARQLYAIIARDNGYSFQTIADLINCDHATVMHSQIRNNDFDLGSTVIEIKNTYGL